MSKDVQKLVGRNVAAIRQAKQPKMTQAALADKIDVDRAYISGLERGERNATIGMLWKVSKALGVKISAIFEEDKKRS
jgi:transcriptional regulator with XRE-family HTH domain